LLQKECAFFCGDMKISDRRLRISDNLKISDFSNSLGVHSLGVLQHPQATQQYAYGLKKLETSPYRVVKNAFRYLETFRRGLRL